MYFFDCIFSPFTRNAINSSKIYNVEDFFGTKSDWVYIEINQSKPKEKDVLPNDGYTDSKN